VKSAKFAAAILIIFLAISGVALGIQAAYKAGFSNNPEAGPEAKWNDLRIFYGAGRMIFQDINIYKNPTSPEGRYYIYPPFFALVCTPFAALGWKVFVILWVAGSLAAIAGAALLCVKIAWPKASPHSRIIIAAIALLLCARPIISDFQNGQINSLIFIVIAASLLLYVRKQDAASGIVMAAAASIKLTALIFLPYFVYKRAWKTVAGMTLGLAFTLFILPTALMGPSRTFELYPSFYNKMVSPFASVTDAPEVYDEAGQSLRAAASRFLKDTNAAHHFTKEIRVNFSDLSAQTVWIIVLAAGALLTLITALCARFNPSDPARREITGIELGSVILLMLMLSPMSRKAHFVALLLPFTAGLAYLVRHWHDQTRKISKRTLLTAICIVFAMLNLTSRDIDKVVGKPVSVYLLALSSFFFATLFLWIAFCLAMRRERARGVPPDPLSFPE